MIDGQRQDEGLTEDEELLVAALPEDLIARIDAAILARTRIRFQKVARIVSLVMRSIPDVPVNVPELFYVQRIAHLVTTGRMECQGDPLRMRFSEVRLPPPPLSSSELDELMAKGDYWTLGCLYADGQGVAQDYLAALKWYRIAAEQGEVWSQFNVGRLYMNGYGVRQDYKQAYFWFGLAASGSSDKRPFTCWIDEVAAKLTAEQRAEVDKQVAEWRPTPGTNT